MASQQVLLLGDRGSGRTSLLNHVAWLLARREEPRQTVMVSGELAGRRTGPPRIRVTKVSPQVHGFSS